MSTTSRKRALLTVLIGAFLACPCVAAMSDAQCDDELAADDMTPPANRAEALRRARLKNDLRQLAEADSAAVADIDGRAMVLEANRAAHNIKSDHEYYDARRALVKDRETAKAEAAEKRLSVLRAYCDARPQGKGTKGR